MNDKIITISNPVYDDAHQKSEMGPFAGHISALITEGYQVVFEVGGQPYSFTDAEDFRVWFCGSAEVLQPYVHLHVGTFFHGDKQSTMESLVTGAINGYLAATKIYPTAPGLRFLAEVAATQAHELKLDQQPNNDDTRASLMEVLLEKVSPQKVARRY